MNKKGNEIDIVYRFTVNDLQKLQKTLSIALSVCTPQMYETVMKLTNVRLIRRNAFAIRSVFAQPTFVVAL